MRFDDPRPRRGAVELVKPKVVPLDVRLRLHEAPVAKETLKRLFEHGVVVERGQPNTRARGQVPFVEPAHERQVVRETAGICKPIVHGALDHAVQIEAERDQLLPELWRPGSFLDETG